MYHVQWCIFRKRCATFKYIETLSDDVRRASNPLRILWLQGKCLWKERPKVVLRKDEVIVDTFREPDGGEQATSIDEGGRLEG